jgi:hypothetical protein
MGKGRTGKIINGDSSPRTVCPTAGPAAAAVQRRSRSRVAVRRRSRRGGGVADGDLAILGCRQRRRRAAGSGSAACAGRGCCSAPPHLLPGSGGRSGSGCAALDCGLHATALRGHLPARCAAAPPRSNWRTRRHRGGGGRLIQAPGTCEASTLPWFDAALGKIRCETWDSFYVRLRRLVRIAALGRIIFRCYLKQLEGSPSRRCILGRSDRRLSCDKLCWIAPCICLDWNLNCHPRTSEAVGEEPHDGVQRSWA